MADCSSLTPNICGSKGIDFPEAPCNDLRIDGVEDTSINQGVSIDLTEGVHAYDGDGNEIPFTVDPETIEKCEVGEHNVKYTALGYGNSMKPTVCGTDALHIDKACADLISVEAERIVTIEQADPPTIVGAEDINIRPNTNFNPLNGVSAEDDNGNPVEVTYDGTYDLEAKGAIASFVLDEATQAKSVTVALSPIQSLNGYDKPWSGGNGKNKLDISNTGHNSYNIYGIPNTLKPNTTYVWSISGTDGGFRFSLWLNNSGTAPATTSQITPYILSGEAATFTTPSSMSEQWLLIGGSASGAGNVDVVALKPMIEEGSTATSYAPYSNECPIYGRTGMNVYDSGVNVWDEETRNGYYSSASGAFVSDSSTMANKNSISVKPSTSYYIKSASYTLVLFYYDSDMNFISAQAKTNAEFTTPSNCNYINFCTSYGAGTTYNHDISINYPSTDHDYHAYHGTTTSVTWQTEAGTVYGGTIDVVSGVLTVDRVCKTLTTASFLSGAYAGSIIYNSTLPETADADFSKPFICNRLNYVGQNPFSSDWKVGTCINANGTSFNLWVKDGAFADLSEASAWLASNTTQICYYLATPQRYKLTPQQIELLHGTNNVWSDGDVSVVYSLPIPQGEAYQYPLQGTYEITYTAEDECGNTTEITRTITVA